MKPFKYSGKYFLFHLKCSFGCWDIPIFVIFVLLDECFKVWRGSWKCNNEMKWPSEIINWNFWSNSKTSLTESIKNGQVMDHWKKENLTTWKGLVTSSRPLLFSQKIVIKKRLDSKIKVKLDFLRIFDNPLSKSFFFKKVSWMHLLYF